MFPENIADLIEEYITDLDGVDFTVMRELAMTDNSRTAGIAVTDWAPTPGGQEIGGTEPTLQTYTLSIQHMVLMPGEEGLRLHREIAKRIRVMLYTDTAFTNALRQLSTTDDGRTERIQKYKVLGQRFDQATVDKNTFVALSVTEVSFDTETIQTS